MKFPFRYSAVLFIVLGILASCATKPEIIRKAPEWVSQPPGDADGSVFFVGAGSDTAGDLPSAEQRAVNNLIAEVSRFIGVSVTAETTIEAKDTLQSYEEEIREKITQSSSASIQDFRVIDKWIDAREDLVIVYLLGEYSKMSLIREQKRIQEVFQEKEEAVAGPEARGDTLLAQGNKFEAGTQYIRAAAAAVESDIDNAEIKFQRNIQKAKESLQALSLIPLTDKLSTNVGEDLPAPFSLKVVDGAGRDDPGIPDVSLLISFREKRETGKFRILSVRGKTDDTGMIDFTPPPPNFVGEETITMRLDLSSSLEVLEDAGESFRPYIESLESVIASKRAEFTYTSVSRAKEYPLGIALLEVDRAGNPRRVSDSAAGMYERLTDEGFIIHAVELHPEIFDLPDSRLISYIAENYGDTIDRAAFGVMSIAEFEETDGSFLVKVSGTLKVADVKSGRIIYTKTQSKRSRANNSLRAISAAFKGLGQEFGDILAAELP